MPYDQSDEKNNIIFATSTGNIRRNRLTDFHNINANGKIAMKLRENDKLVNVIICSEKDNIFMSTKLGKCIRFGCKDLRIFSGRSSVGVRGKVGKSDSVISLAILNGVDFDVEERNEYLRVSSSIRKKEKYEMNLLSEDKFKILKENEEFILSVTDKGFGKRSSAFEYRKTNRGGVGIANMQLEKETEVRLLHLFQLLTMTSLCW